MRYLIVTLFVLATAVHAGQDPGAQAELLQARAALAAGRFSEAFQYTAKVQVFYYRDAEAVAEALYCEALADHKTGGSRAKVSALTELKTLYPDSTWCRKAIAEFESGGTE